MKARRMRGFTLVELLVAVLIMAVGVLGIAGLQVESMQQNHSALFRAEALQLTNAILDRIRANKNVTYSALMGAPPASTTDCEVSSCTPTQLEAYDVAQWKCSINSEDSTGQQLTVCNSLKGLDGSSMGITGELPDGDGSITLANGVYTVTVQWVDSHSGSTSSISVTAQVN